MVILFYFQLLGKEIHGFPVYKFGQYRLSMLEILRLIINQDLPEKCICDKVPTGIRESAIFVVRYDPENYNDLSVDDNGIYKKPSGPSELLNIKQDKDENVVDFHFIKDDEYLSSDTTYVVHRKYYLHSSSRLFKRTIITIEHKGSPLPTAIIQYKIDDSNIILKKHGNMKHEDKPFYRVKPSVLKEVRNQIHQKPVKAVVQSIEKASGGVMGGSTPSAVLRNTTQVYNQLKNAPDRLKFHKTGPPKTPEYNKLLQMSQTGHFVRQVTYNNKTDKRGRSFLNINTFAATDTTLKFLKKFCLGKKPRSQAQIDMTYKMVLITLLV